MEELYEIMLYYGTHPDRDIQENAQMLFYKGHQASKRFADARDGFDRQGKMYTRDEKIDLVCHAVDYLLEGNYPNFIEISEHMKRTPEALQQQLQKLFIQSNWSWKDLVRNYGITRMQAELLIAPQHKTPLNK